MTPLRTRCLRAVVGAAILATPMAATAWGRTTPYWNHEANLAFSLPYGWTTVEGVDDTGRLSILMRPPDGAGMMVLLVARISDANRADWSAPVNDLLGDALRALQLEVPSAEPQRTYDVQAGAHGWHALDYAGIGVAGSLLLHVRGEAVYTVVTFATVAEPDASDVVQAALDAFLSTLVTGFVMLP